ncbi:MAG: 50S ribosomal protein L11 methyltransferase [Bacteroidetes bacterium]|nr:50S ribosomal protein L11 methyltransferase [Bacteroidota bacterium]
MDYIEFDFTVSPLEPHAEILTTNLAELGFDSFVDTEKGFLAYIPQNVFTKDVIKSIGEFYNSEVSVTYTYRAIQQQNWNKIWEDNFKPIVVADKCAVRATFHEPMKFPYEIIIDPKMAFGTGHHETTSMVMETMLGFDFNNKLVADIGAGTGILSILASKLGATSIAAVDIDEWPYESILENSFLNQIENITAYKGTVDLFKNLQFDIVLANINKNVILQDVQKYYEILNKGGLLILSGFYEADCPDILAQTTKLNLKEIKRLVKNNWTCLTLQF